MQECFFHKTLSAVALSIESKAPRPGPGCARSTIEAGHRGCLQGPEPRSVWPFAALGCRRPPLEPGTREAVTGVLQFDHVRQHEVGKLGFEMNSSPKSISKRA